MELQDDDPQLMPWDLFEDTVLKNPYIPKDHEPYNAQIDFLRCEHDYALYGGGARAGKSEALLMAALQFCHDPIYKGYNALIVRRSLQELKLADGLMQRALDWLKPRLKKRSRGGDVEWNGQDYRFTFPSGATLQFGYCDNEGDELRYHGAMYQYIGLDECVQFTEKQIRFFMSERLSRGANLPVPVRFRAATTPGGVGHCLPHGRVLTPTGWKEISEFKVGDPVCAVNAQGELVNSVVDQVHEQDYDGDMVHVNLRGFRLTCTPNHRVAQTIRKRDAKKRLFKLTEFDRLPGQATVLRSVKWQGTELDSFAPERVATRKRKLQQPSRLTGDQYAALMGWFLSEGCIPSTTKSFDIAQMKPEGRVKVEAMLNDCGFVYYAGKTYFRVCAPDWWAHLKQFGKCRDKFIPESLKNATPRQLNILLDALMSGDGHREAGSDSGTYYTTSRQLADDVAEVALKLGFVVSIHTRQRENRSGPSYEVHIKRVRSGGTEVLTGQHVLNVATTMKRKSDVRRERFSGKVYCLGVPEHHTFVVMQDGCVWVSGNSYIKHLFVDPGLVGIYVPATIHDNLALDAEDYGRKQEINRLADPLRYRQVMLGDWDAMDGGRFKQEWFGRWHADRHLKDTVILRDSTGAEVERFRPEECGRFQTCDPAISTSTKADAFVLSTFLLSPKANLVWLHCQRGHYDFPRQVELCKYLYRRFQPQFLGVEDVAYQRSLIETLQRSLSPTMIVKPLRTGGQDKLARAAGAIALAASKRIFLPGDEISAEENPTGTMLSELVAFTGEKKGKDDVTDTLSYACAMLPFVRAGHNGHGARAPIRYTPRDMRQLPGVPQ